MRKLRLVERFTNSRAAAKVVPEPPLYVLMFDGGSRGNPGPSGAGYVVYYDDEEVAYGFEYIGTATNNIAEYTGLICGLIAAAEMGIERLVIKGDSLLVLNQLAGVWAIKAPNLVPLYNEAKGILAKYFPDATVQHVKRAHNKRADELANEAMDKKTSDAWLL